MLPILLARQIEEGLRAFLRTSFPVTTPAFQREGGRTFLDDFLEREGALLKGPWIEVKLPFRLAQEGVALPFRKLELPFPPYQHQVRAFERLCGKGARSTLVATGTGSGKTECFMYPLLDHCLLHRERGIKAIVIYPMNALATDQARRFAKECASLAKRGLPRLSVGLFTGEGGHERSMGEEQVITDRETLRANPPDILLTNYKMLDFLLMRPQDQPLWQHNKPGVLRYLVVDELHTFDGAQGTDLACLIRRLRAKLKAGDELACVGTSATLGGPEALEPLRRYAEDVFAASFEPEAIILEDRLKVEEYLEGALSGREVLARWPTDRVADLQPRDTESAEAYLARAAEVWLGRRFDLEAPEEAVRLGEELPRLTAFQELLRKAHTLSDAAALASEWRQRFRLERYGEASVLLDSLCALVSAARSWKRAGEETGPFLQVRVQLWIRELRRMVCRVGDEPVLVHGDDVVDVTDPLQLPLLHCRECHGMAWGAVQPDGDHRLKADLQGFYQAWFHKKPDAVLLYPLAGQEGGRWRAQELRSLCLRCRATFPHREGGAGRRSCPECDGELLPVWMPDIRRQESRKGENRTVVTSDCPCCGARSGLIVLGSQAASLASVFIGELFGSAFNDDKKLIAFSDSVQDAAHRAGFFGARTYTQVLRNALAGFIRERGAGLCLPKVAEEFPRYWQHRLRDDRRFVGTFIAPNMEWLRGFQELKASGEIPEGSDIAALVSRRLSWEVFSEFGLRSRIGRTLERTGVATAQLDEARLHATAENLARRLREEMETLRGLTTEKLAAFLLGFLTRSRQIGAFYTPDLERYVQEGGKTYILNELMHHMPSFGAAARPPAMLSLERISDSFEHLLAPGSWFVDWFERCTEGLPLAQNERPQVFSLLLDALAKDGWLLPLSVRGQTVWGLDPARWTITTDVKALACNRCQHQFPFPTDQIDLHLGLACLKKGCAGSYRPSRAILRRNAYRAEPHRLVPSEHTALMAPEKRRVVELSFKKKREAQEPWDVNLLSATPTLEMGIDIGDLSSVLLCSVPPGQANYLQRIGRAGRRDGNALSVTIAGGRPHDLYFYGEPTEMMAGQVAPPGVFLKAVAVLERQLTAFCFDRWVESDLGSKAIPPKLRDVLNALEAQRKDVFPHTFLDFVERRSAELLEDFLALFPSKEADPELRRIEEEERRSHFTRYLEGGQGEGTLGWRVLDRLEWQVKTRKGLLERTQELKNRISRLQGRPADEERDNDLADCRRERQALLALVGSINDRQTLNFFTDEGLLPNYAFPEEGVTLNSVILRRRERRDDGGAGMSDEKTRLSFQRSAQAALGELVPDAMFYAAEHQLNIDQVDLKLSKPESWRLCPACSYSENLEESGDPHAVCPRCGHGGWRDVGQKRTLLKLRQVFARADARKDRIGDDSDERVPTFYRRQLLVDVPPEAHGGAYRLDREDLPFGFEYLRHVSFREINFGEAGNGTDAFRVAGRNEARTGFQICSACGMVRRRTVLRKGQFAHALDCKFSRSGLEPEEKDWLSSLYLYREFQSEAVRILLPLADVAHSEGTRKSFTAALLMGLKAYYEGEVQHLGVTEMQEPGADGVSVSQYLVIFDQVPGGTGYLKELLRSPENLMRLLRLAYERMQRCACGHEEGKDGCYRCILAYRTSRDRSQISRRSAMDLLDRLLGASDALVSAPRLGGIGQGVLLESPLEARFIVELGRVKGLKVLKKVVNGRPGYWVHAKGPDDQLRTWELEPQRELGPAEGVALTTRPDFLLRPVREGDRKAFGEWALYLDGFAYHWNKVSDDARKRMAVLRSGRRVWSLGWHDLPSGDADEGTGAAEFLLKDRDPRMLGIYDQLARGWEWTPSEALTGLLLLDPFKLLAKMLQEPAEVLAKLQHAGVCNGIAWLHDRSFQDSLWQEPSYGLPGCVPAAAMEAYGSMGEPILCGGLLEGRGTKAGPVRIGICIPKGALPLQAKDLSKREQLAAQMGVHLCLEDSMAESGKDFEAPWRGFWRAANVLQFVPRFTLAAGSDLADSLFNGMVAPLFAPAADGHGDARGWAEVRQLSFLEPTDLETMESRGLPVPVPGLDVQVGIETAWTAELAWPERKVALLLGGDAPPLDMEGWTVIVADGPDWMERLASTLKT